MSRWPALAVICLAACSRDTVTATLTDDLTSTPIANTPVVARATGEVPFDCQTLEGETDEQGVVTLDGACLSSSAYRFEPGDPMLWFIDGATVEAGSSGRADVRVLHAPAGSGAYMLSGGNLEALSTHGDVKQATVVASEEVVEFPSSMPAEDEVPHIGPESWLVLTGLDNADSARLIPMVKSGPRRLARRGDVMTQQDWWYMGVRFASDSEFTRLATMIDDSRVRRHVVGDRAVSIIPYNAVPAGRYALRTPSSNRITVVDMGTPPVATTE